MAEAKPWAKGGGNHLDTATIAPRIAMAAACPQKLPLGPSKAVILGGEGRGVSPRPQPQTGHASFQASGFPDESKHLLPSRF
jgi:hypothetical protein